MNDTENDVRIYELGYWFVPTIPEMEVEAQVTELKNKLTSKVAVIITEEEPYLRELAYEMCKVIDNKNNYFNDGYFGWVKFEMDPQFAVPLHHELELDKNIIRSMIVQTVRENTVSTKRPASLSRANEEVAVDLEGNNETKEVEIDEVKMKEEVVEVSTKEETVVSEEKKEVEAAA